MTMSGHCECARAARHTMHRVHTAQGSCCFICRYYHGTQCGSGTVRGSHHVTITSAFSSQYWIRWPLNSYFLIVCKKYRTVPLLSSPVRCPPVSQSTAHIYANPPFSNFHHQLGVLLVAGWAGLVWLVPLIINLEIKTKARLAAAAVSGPTPAPAPTLGEYTI